MKTKTRKSIRNQQVAIKAFQKTKAKAVVQDAVRTVATHYVDASTRTQSLIQTGKQAAVRFFQNVAADYEKCRPVEVLCSYYMEELETYRPDISAPIYANLLIQLKAWRVAQMERILQGKEIEAFEGLNQFLASAVGTKLFEWVKEIMSTILPEASSGAPSSLATRPTTSTIVGGASLTDTPVWDTNDYNKLHGLYRTAVMEHFACGLEVMRPQTGNMEPVIFAPQETPYRMEFHATTMERWLPLPTQLTDIGHPQQIYSVDPRVGRITWSATQGQFYLELLQKPTSPRQITVTAYTNDDYNPWLPRLTPHMANLPASKPNETIKAALSPVTRKIFEEAEKMGRQDLYSNFALTKFEQLQYAAARLRGSWTYNRRPKHLDAAKADGARWLSHLHQDKEVTTANCNVANTEFAVAARAFGYPVRIVTGFAGQGRPTLDAPEHEWVEVRVGNIYREIDATPGFTLEDHVIHLDDNIRYKLRMIAEYDQDPKYRERDALYAQLPHTLNAATLGKLFNTLSALPIEEERLDKVGDHQERVIYNGTVGISQQTAPERWRMDVYDRDPLQPNEQGRYRGYVVSDNSLAFVPHSSMNEDSKTNNGILEWHIDSQEAPKPTQQPPLESKTPLRLKALHGEATPGAGESYKGRDVEYMSISGHPGRKFRVCSYMHEIQKVWNPLNKDGKSILVEGLQQLTFEPVQVEEEGFDEDAKPVLRTVYYAFNAKYGLLVSDEFTSWTTLTDSRDKLWELTVTFDQTRILAVEHTAREYEYREHTNHAVKFSHAFFEHMQGRPVTSASDRGLLVRALALVLRHPPTTMHGAFDDMAALSYVLSEAKRLHIRPEEVQEVTTASAPAGPKAVICDGIRLASKSLKPGCDVIWSESPSIPDPVTLDGLWIYVMRYISRSVGKYRKRYRHDFTALSPSRRAWMEKLIQQHFKPMK